ncbi:MAG TPA: stage II sporulation protein M [Nitrososphaera sp.]|nr:stage II sporulation protein M [Nitrososphaera sp.]
MRFKIGKQRLLYLAFGIAAFLIAYSAGAAVPLSDEEAKEVREQFAEQIEGIDETGIFINNVRIALGMFIPGLGAGLGLFSGFATGSVFAALANSSPALEGIPPLLIFLTPFGAMELFTYGLAMSRSGMLVYYFVKKRPWRDYAVPTLIELGIAAAVLLAAAVIEWQIIEQLGGLDDVSIIIEPA